MQCNINCEQFTGTGYSSTSTHTVNPCWPAFGTGLGYGYVAVKVLVASNEFSKECRMRANYSDLHQFRMKSNPRISKGLISESKFRFETAGSIRSSTLILKHAFDKVKGMQQARKLPKPLVKL